MVVGSGFRGGQEAAPPGEADCDPGTLTACQMTPNKSRSETRFPHIKMAENNTYFSKLL